MGLLIDSRFFNCYQLFILTFNSSIGIGINKQDTNHHGNGSDTDGTPYRSINKYNKECRKCNDYRYDEENNCYLDKNHKYMGGQIWDKDQEDSPKG